MKAIAKENFSIERNLDVTEGQVINLSSQQFSDYSSAGLVKKATKQDIENHLKNKGELKDDKSPLDDENQMDEDKSPLDNGGGQENLLDENQLNDQNEQESNEEGN